MENDKLIGLFVTLTVGIILVATLVVPVINSAETEYTETYANGSAEITQIYSDSPDDLTIVFEADASTFTVNDVEYDAGTYTRWGIFASDALSIQIGSASGVDTLYIMQPSVAVTTGTLSEGFTLTATADGDLTLVYGSESTTITTTYNWMIYLDSDGSLVWASVSEDEPRYIKAETDVYVAYSFASGANYLTYADGVAAKNGTETTVEFTTSEVSGTDGEILELTAVTFESSKTVTYLYVPVSVDYVSSENGAAINLLFVIPLLLIVSLLVMVVRAINRPVE